MRGLRGRIGLIINPFAGMGGRLGFKGTDGALALRAAMMGARPVAPARARAFLEALKPGPRIVAPPGPMGFESLRGTAHEGLADVIECVPPKTWPTTAADTRRCAKMMLGEGVDLLVFVGGDGTARDVFDAVDKRVPVLGVPSGVKVYSGVFSLNPRSAGRIVNMFYSGGASLSEREVLDIDEEAYRRGRLDVRLYGYMIVPESPGLVESGKHYFTQSEEEELEAIARHVVESMEEGVLYIMGPGRTVESIARALGQKKTPLGVDAYYNGELVGEDLDEAGILRLLDRYPRARIVVSPIGGQGFILGRGNQQISPEVVRRVGAHNVIVVSTRAKLRTFKTLKVDTGDEEVDTALRGYRRVVTGYGRETIVKVE